jgi:uncharacterized membrane protein YedE/YeeE
MEPSATNHPRPILPPTDDPIAETQALRRKVVFWRRVAWLAFGGAGIVMLVVWTRGETRRRDCFESLRHYADLARTNKLAEQHPEILEQQWQELEQAATGIPPEHYDLIVKNWTARPGSGEEPVLAVGGLLTALESSGLTKRRPH